MIGFPVSQRDLRDQRESNGLRVRRLYFYNISNFFYFFFKKMVFRFNLGLNYSH